MRLRSSLIIALLVVAAGACTAAPDRGGQPATIAAATTTTAQTTTAQASTAMKRQTRLAPPGLLPVARRQPAPTLEVTAFDGRTVSLVGLRGRPVVVSFFESWCGICQAEQPDLTNVVVSFFESWCGICQAEQPDLTNVAGDFAGRVGFVGVSYRDTVAAGRAYQRRFKVPYPLANDASGRTWARWRVPYQPVVVLVDKHGRIAERFDGGTTGGTLAAAVAYLLGE